MPRISLRSNVPLLLAAAVMTITAANAGDPSRPNVIQILADDMGWDIAALGNPFAITPNLDRLVSEGRVFGSYYAGSPVCSPTRVSTLSGMMPSRHRIHSFIGSPDLNRLRDMANYLDPSALTVADVAKRAGYRTGHYGKWHIGPLGDPAPSEYGFDVAGIDWARDVSFWPGSSNQIVSGAISFMNSLESDECFYLNIWLLHMHRPVRTTEVQRLPYVDRNYSTSDLLSYTRTYAEQIEDFDDHVIEYYAAVTAMDAAIGTLLNYLDDKGLADNTLVFFTSDNGPEDYRLSDGSNPGAGSADVYRGRKRSLYEGGIRMPTIARLPGVIPPGSRDDTSVMTTGDWLPTVAALLGEAVPLGLDGQDRSDVLLGTPAARPGNILWEYRTDAVGNPEYDSPRFALRSGDWKYLYEPDGSRPGELYNVVVDPEERTELSQAQPDMALELKNTIEERISELEPQAPVLLSGLDASYSLRFSERTSIKVAASGFPAPTYQWFLNGLPAGRGEGFIVGGESPVLTFEFPTFEQAGTYQCVARNSEGVATIDIDVDVFSEPLILTQPNSVILGDGDTAVFEIEVIGTGPLSYQWFLGDVALVDGESIEGAATSVLTIEDTEGSDSVGRSSGYSCQISNEHGAITSDAAGLLVNETGTSIPYQLWIEFYAGSDPVLSLPQADYDGDGVSNVVEYAMVGDPGDSAELSSLSVTTDMQRENLLFSYDRIAGGQEWIGGYRVHDLFIGVEISMDGTTWSIPEVEPVLVESTPLPNPRAENVVFSLPLSGDPEQLSIRLRISLIP